MRRVLPALVRAVWSWAVARCGDGRVRSPPVRTARSNQPTPDRAGVRDGDSDRRLRLLLSRRRTAPCVRRSPAWRAGGCAARSVGAADRHCALARHDPRRASGRACSSRRRRTPGATVSQADLWLARRSRRRAALHDRNAMATGGSGVLLRSGIALRFIQGGAIVPTYPPGLPVLMAAGKARGRGVRTIPDRADAGWPDGLADLPARCSPVIATRGPWRRGAAGNEPDLRLMTVLSPMSDVPATAFFTLGLVLALSSWRWRAFWTGAAVSMAIFIRPNLVLVGAVFLAFIVMTRRTASTARQARGARRARSCGLRSGGAPLVLAVAALNAALYGAPWTGGHGNVGGPLFLAVRLAEPHRLPTLDVGELRRRWSRCAVVPLMAWRHVCANAARRWRFLASFIAAVWVSYLVLPRVRTLAVSAVPAADNSGAAGSDGVGPGDVGGPSCAGQRSALRRCCWWLLRSCRCGSDSSAPSSCSATGGRAFRTRVLGSMSVASCHRTRSFSPSSTAEAFGTTLTGRRCGGISSRQSGGRAPSALRERGYRPYVLVTDVEEQPFRTRFGLSGADRRAGHARGDAPRLEGNRSTIRCVRWPPSPARCRKPWAVRAGACSRRARRV